MNFIWPITDPKSVSPGECIGYRRVITSPHRAKDVKSTIRDTVISLCYRHLDHRDLAAGGVKAIAIQQPGSFLHHHAGLLQLDPQHYPDFLSAMEAQDRSLPGYVQDEFDQSGKIALPKKQLNQIIKAAL
jgi:hypothetical protein